MTFKSGKRGTATVNGVEVPLINWGVRPSVPLAEFLNSKTGGFIKRESGAGMSAQITFGIDHDFDAVPFGSPLNLTIGAVLTNVKLYLDGTSGTYWNFPSVVVSDTPQELVLNGKITTNITASNDGTFAYPGGTTPSNGV